jgi:hypothetical protein
MSAHTPGSQENQPEIATCGCYHYAGHEGRIVFCPLHTAAPALLEALQEIAKSTHHITLSGAASRHLDCPPCIAMAAINRLKAMLEYLRP